MTSFGEPDGFFGFLRDTPLFFRIFGGLVFTLVVGTFLFIIIKGLKSWISNNSAEVPIQVPVRITSLLSNLKIARGINSI
ncbi:hypothetical protein PaeBR_15585 [Paenibacillus sp. BR2-3]|uniref:hypothetical protein n=1 Tax=Paenibacillus sp. BR2-3 TaxID=3048494 RepID=UPI003977B354